MPAGPLLSASMSSRNLRAPASTPCRPLGSTRPIVLLNSELMHLLEGSVTFEDASGSTTFSKGDIFLAARGAQCAWLSEVHVKKVYAIHRPA